MIGQQLEISAPVGKRLTGDELDHAIHDCMSTIWRKYREAVIANNYKPYNDCFSELYDKYPDLSVQRFIQGMGMGMVEALNRRVKG